MLVPFQLYRSLSDKIEPARERTSERETRERARAHERSRRRRNEKERRKCKK